MIIYRDGQAIELTFSEMIRAHEEYELDCMIQDVKSVYEQGEYDVELSEEDIGEVAMFALHNLSKNDGYYDSYWGSVQYTLDSFVDNMPIEEEED